VSHRPRRDHRGVSGGPLRDQAAADLLAQVAAADPALAPYAVADPGPARFGAELGERRFVIEAVYEGYLLHYGEPRVFDGMDGDLRLLAGDALYAFGLARLAALGDLPAVAELSDLITRSAQAHAEARGDQVERLWDASAARLAAAPR
jgi:hypothetical protein